MGAAESADSAAGSRTLSSRALGVSLVLAALAAVASRVANRAIVVSFPDRPTPRDALFELLPYVSEARYITAVALIAGLVLFLIHAIRSERAEIPRFISVISIMYLLRAAMIILTPLASSHGEGAFVFPIVQYGMFPSGHTAVMLLCATLVDRVRYPTLRRVQMALAVAVWVALVLAHGHYSIDVAGGLLLGYFVETEWSKGTMFAPIKRAMGHRVTDA